MRRFLPFAALLGVAFVLGCQDVGTGVVASDGPGPQFAVDCEANPDHKKCNGGGGGGGKDIPVGVTVGGGMTAQQQPMQLAEDDSRLRLASDEPDFVLANNLTNTSLEGIEECVQTGRGAPNNEWADSLFAELVQPPAERGLFVRIDKTALGRTSDTHRIHNADNSEIGGIKIKVFEPTVTVPDDNVSGDFVATFSGGDIAVSGSPTGKIKDRVFLTCPIQPGDDIIVTVVR